MIYRLLLVLLIAFSASPLAAQRPEPRRVALVIGNDDYLIGRKLLNARNDAALIAAAARRTGFSVTVASDLDLARFNASLREFRDRAEGAEVAMIYYAGHGLENGGRNWLVPTDARLASQLDLPYEAIDLDRVLEAVSGAKIRMAVLDACRDNPFGRSWPSRSRAVSRGLAEVVVDDVLVIYSAAPGSVADDGAGANSPFATSFAARLSQPDLALQLLGGMVRDDVLASTGNRQRPYVSASITGTPIYLVSRPAAPPAARPTSSRPPDFAMNQRRSRLASELSAVLSMQKSSATEAVQGDLYSFLTRPSGSEPPNSVAANSTYVIMFVRNPDRKLSRLCESRRGYYAVGFALAPNLEKDIYTFRPLSMADRPLAEPLCRGLRSPLSALFVDSPSQASSPGRGTVWDWLARNSGTVSIMLTPANAFGRGYEDRIIRRYWALGLASRYAQAAAPQFGSDPAAFAQMKAIQSGRPGTFGSLRDGLNHIISNGLEAYPAEARRDYGEELERLDSAWAEFLSGSTVRVAGGERSLDQSPFTRSFARTEIGSAQFWRSAHDVRNLTEQANCLADRFLKAQGYAPAYLTGAGAC